MSADSKMEKKVAHNLERTIKFPRSMIISNFGVFVNNINSVKYALKIN